MTDLVALCQAGDRKAQEHIFRSYYSDFLKICLRYARDQQSAEVMLSDAYFKIFTKVSSYNGSGSFEGWMKRVVVNTCLTHFRNNSTEKSISLPEGGVESPALHRSHAANEALSRLNTQELIRIIQTLPPVSRTVFNLFVFEGFSHKEIGASLGISEGTSQWHVSSARQWLKSKITAL